MAGRTDKVKASMNPGVVVEGEAPLDLQLFLQVSLELLIDVVHNGLEAVLLVHLVAVPQRVHNRQLRVKVKPQS